MGERHKRHGGNGEAANNSFLKRSELKRLAKMAEGNNSRSRIPFTEEDRRKARDILMATLETVHHPRYVIAGLNAFAALERVNIASETNELPPPPAQVNNNTQINVSLNGLTNNELDALRTTAGLLESEGDRVAPRPEEPPGDRD